MIAWLWQFLAGYVTIKIEGLKLLAFVNDATAQGILLRNAERRSYSRIFAKVSWRDYRRLIRLTNNRPLRVVALTQGGLPIVAAGAVKRLAFTIGMLLCIGALVIINQFVLTVRVDGCTQPELEAKVREIAAGDGLVPGAAKSGLDLHGIEKALMLDLGEISFAAIRVNGVVATVNIVEGVPAPAIVDRNKPCNVTAMRDGVVRKVLAYDGQVKVLAGEAVKRGQVLVSGEVVMAGSVKIVHARGDVLASVWVEGQGSAPLFSGKNIRSGEVSRRQWVEFSAIVIPIGPQELAAYESFEQEQTASWLLGPGLKGPRLITVSRYEAYPSTEERNFSSALEKALGQALEQATAKVPKTAEILDSRTVYDFTDGNIVVKVYIEALENIAEETPLG